MNTYTVTLTLKVEAHSLSSATTLSILAIVGRNQALIDGTAPAYVQSKGAERLEITDVAASKGDSK